MEHERWMEIKDIDEKNAMLDAMQHNLRVAGENNHPVRINRLHLLPELKLQKAYSDSLWTIKRIMSGGQVLVKHEAEHINDEPHVEVWGRHRLCRVPKGIV